MVDRTKTIRVVVALVYLPFAVIVVAVPGPAAADNLGEAKSEETAWCGRRFEPGPIVNGHNRQPTPAEFEARRQELDMFSKEAFTGSIQSQAGTCRTR
jgi:hypothetical protein